MFLVVVLVFVIVVVVVVVAVVVVVVVVAAVVFVVGWMGVAWYARCACLSLTTEYCRFFLRPHSMPGPEHRTLDLRTSPKPSVDPKPKPRTLNPKPKTRSP